MTASLYCNMDGYENIGEGELRNLSMVIGGGEIISMEYHSTKGKGD